MCYIHECLRGAKLYHHLVHHELLLLDMHSSILLLSHPCLSKRKVCYYRLIPLYNVIAWLGPLCIIGPMLVFGKLGYALYVAANWCYIKDSNGGPLTKKV